MTTVQMHSKTRCGSCDNSSPQCTILRGGILLQEMLPYVMWPDAFTFWIFGRDLSHGCAVVIHFADHTPRFQRSGAACKQQPAAALFSDFSACHNPLVGCRIGEAANPGPIDASVDSLQISVLNPTALHGKTSDVLEMGSSVYFVAETSATDYAQKILSKEYSKANIKCFWSLPSPDKFATDDGRPSLRGDALGTAILSRVPSRSYRGSVSPVLLETCRFSSCVIQLKDFEFLAISVYGFPSSTLAIKKQNDLPLGLAYQVAIESGLPFIIAGDFNTKVDDLPIFSEISAAGHVEIFSWYRSRGIELPPTCRGSTRNDTCILHATLAQFVLDVHIESNPAFDAHAPMTVSLSLCQRRMPSSFWSVPKSWTSFDVIPLNVELCYFQIAGNISAVINDIGSAETGENALVAWSQAVESSVDRAIQLQHRLDPIRHPAKCLPDTAKGRCRGVLSRRIDNGSAKMRNLGDIILRMRSLK